MKTEMVCGFMFSNDFSEVLLINKEKPDWQKGKLNGIGGKVEKDELAIQTMTREFQEETGIVNNDWIYICALSGQNWFVHFYAGIGDIYKAKQMEIEIPKIVHVNSLPNNIISNLKWLIPLGIYRFQGGYGEKLIGDSLS